jgi:hypothetical protein
MSVDLELASTEQLLDELFKRKTFAGVVVYSEETHRFSGQCHNGFILRTTCEDESVIFLLEQGIEAVVNKVKEDES